MEIPYTLEELSCSEFRYKPEPFPFLIEGLIPLGVSGTVYSGSGVGKSSLMLDMALRFSLFPEVNTNWLDKFKILSGGNILYVSGEDPKQIFHERFHKLVDIISKEQNVPRETIQKLAEKNFHVLSCSNRVEYLFRKEGSEVIANPIFNKIKSTIKAHNIKLVLIDTKSRLSGLPENDNAVAAKEVNLYEQLTFNNQCTVLVIHHSGKSKNTDLSNSFRGASSFISNCRFGIFLDKSLSEKIRSEQGLMSDDKTEFIQVSNPKQNYCQAHPPFIIERSGFSFKAIDYDLSGTNSGSNENKFEMICNFLKENPGITQSNIIENFSGELSNHKVRDYVKELIETGRVVKLGNSKKKSTLFLANEEKKAA